MHSTEHPSILLTCEYDINAKEENHCSANRKMYLYHGRANAIRPYEHDITMY